MDYDFSGLCSDQLVKLTKRLEALNKSFMKEYIFALNVINSPIANTNRDQTVIEIEDLLRDQVGKCEIFYTETFNKIQRVLARDL